MIKVVTASHLNFRESPGGNILITVPKGTRLESLGNFSVKKYIRVKFIERGLLGYVHEDYVEDEKKISLPEGRRVLVDVATALWSKFENGRGKEFNKPYSKYVGRMWESIGLSLDGEDTDVPWSAAFISYCVRQAAEKCCVDNPHIESKYSTFKFSAAHAKYVHDSIKRKGDSSSPFHGLKVTECKPQPGDIVCRGRSGSGVSYNYASNHDAFKSHCDIVISVYEDHLVAIGGNVSDSVNPTMYDLTPDGYLDGSKKDVYAILVNNTCSRKIEKIEEPKLKLKTRYFKTSDPKAYVNEVSRIDGSKEVHLIGGWDEE